MTLNQQNAHTFPRYLYYNTTLNIPTYFSQQGTIIRELNHSNIAKTKLFTLYTVDMA